MEENHKWIGLLIKYLQGELTPGEADLFEKMRSASKARQRQVERMSDPDYFLKGLRLYANTNAQTAREKYFTKKGRVIIQWARSCWQRNTFLIIKTVAVFIIFSCLIAWLLKVDRENERLKDIIARSHKKIHTNNQESTLYYSEWMPQEQITWANRQNESLENLIQPAIQVEGGRNYNLNELTDNSFTDIAGMQLWKKERNLIVTSLQNKQKVRKQTLNALKVPKGQIVNIRLSDSSQVWVDSAASLIFPASFTGNTREVKAYGTCFFDIAPDSSKPFIVRLTDSTALLVKGTRFKISTYQGKPTVITLFEGSIAIKYKGNTIVLDRPGQQASLDPEKPVLIKEVPLDKEAAWYATHFDFNGLDIRNVLLQLAKWYNRKIIVSGRFSGKPSSGLFSRTQDLADILNFLKMHNHFDIKDMGDTLFITGTAGNNIK